MLLQEQPALLISEPPSQPLNLLYLEAKSIFLICHLHHFPSSPLSPNSGIVWVLSVTYMTSQAFVCWSLLDLMFFKDGLDGWPEACLSLNLVEIDVGSYCCEGQRHTLVAVDLTACSRSPILWLGWLLPLECHLHRWYLLMGPNLLPVHVGLRWNRSCWCRYSGGSQA